tara:strand:+ start:428 stop:982 length:555 start_codon:yes stop_codon:yes gene_type:complete
MANLALIEKSIKQPTVNEQTDKILIKKKPEQLERVNKNNAGNLERAGYAGEMDIGYGENNRFPYYDHPVMGVRALLYDVNKKKLRHNGDVREILTEYAPLKENPNLEDYIAFVEDSLDSKNVTDDNIEKMAEAMITFENQTIPGKVNYYLENPTIMEQAMKLYKIELPSDTSYVEASKILLGME